MRAGDGLGYGTEGLVNRALVLEAVDGRLTTYSRDSTGSLLAVTDPLGQTASYTRDALQEAVAERAADALGGIGVVEFVAHAGEPGQDAPAVLARIDVVVDGDQAGRVVLAQLAEQLGVGTPEDAAEVFGDDQVVRAGLDLGARPPRLFTVEALAAATTGDPGEIKSQGGCSASQRR